MSYIIWTPRQEPPNLWQIPLVLEPSEKYNTELRCAGGNLKPTLHLAHQLSTSTLGFRGVVDAAKRQNTNESRNFLFTSESRGSSVDLHSNSIVCNCKGFEYARIKKSPFSRSQRKIPNLYVSTSLSLLLPVLLTLEPDFVPQFQVKSAPVRSELHGKFPKTRGHRSQNPLRWTYAPLQ